MRKNVGLGLSVFIMFIFLILTCKTVKSVTNEAPAAAAAPDVQVKPPVLELFTLGEKGELLYSGADRRSYSVIDSPLFKQVVYPFDDTKRHRFNSLYFDEEYPDLLAVTTSTHVFCSTDRGASFYTVPLSGINSVDYITSAVILAHNPAYLAVGTSFSGFYLTRDKGVTWKKINKPLLTFRGAGFFEEIASLLPVKGEENQLYLLYAYGKGLLKIDLTAMTAGTLALPELEDFPRRLSYVQGKLALYTPKGVWLYDAEKKEFFLDKTIEVAADNTPLPGTRLHTAADKKGIFLTAYQASDETKLKGFIQFLKEYKLNSIVVDMKDDRGKVTYDTRLELPAKLTGKPGPIKLEQLLKLCHSEGIYVIGRVVVFKDQALYTHNNNLYALRDKYTGEPWRNLIKVEDASTDEISYEQREFWVDPYCPFVWEYNSSIAKELQDRGMDEIQFDYIRFPSDGDTSRITSNYRREGMRGIDALESFLVRVRQDITIPLSTDLYGFNSFYRMGNWIGQNMEMVSHYVDAICPMFYPSHFPRDFMSGVNYIDRAGLIYEEGTARAREIVQGRSVIRPYVQAFLLPGELYMEENEYHSYLIKQVEGTNKAKGSGFTLWNMSNRYYMASPQLKEYID